MGKWSGGRLPAAALALALCLGLLAGCGGETETVPAPPPQAAEPAAPETPEAPGAEPAEEAAEPEGNDADALPEDFPQTFTFLSGAGGWRTHLTLEQDGSFAGEFTDGDAGNEEYPNGFCAICTFTGQFGDLRQADETTWELTLEEIVPQEEPGTQWAEDGRQYTAADPYGLEAGTAFALYSPETPTEDLDEAFLSWWPGDGQPPETLECWGLWNREMGYGFFTYDQW